MMMCFSVGVIRHVDDAAVQRQAARCLLMFVETRAVTAELGALNVVSALVAAMTHPAHCQNAVLQEQVTRAVMILCEDRAIATQVCIYLSVISDYPIFK